MRDDVAGPDGSALSEGLGVFLGARTMGKWLERLKEYEREERMRQDLDSAKAWLTLLRSEGFVITRRGGDIHLKSSSRLTDERRQIIRELKPHLLALLVIEDA